MRRSLVSGMNKHRGARPQRGGDLGHSCTTGLGRVRAGSWRTGQVEGGKVSSSQLIKTMPKHRNEIMQDFVKAPPLKYDVITSVF